jgi:coniferyl-aldehyde dehydrogenase
MNTPRSPDLSANCNACVPRRRAIRSPWDTRAKRLRAMETMLRDHRSEIADGDQRRLRLPADAKKPTCWNSFPACRRSATHCAMAAAGCARGVRWPGLAFLPARNDVLPQPLGVVGIIVPWNYPLYLAIGPLVDALVAGNRAMVKMSEFTPRFSALFAELIARHFKPDEVLVVNGDADVAQAFSALPFDHLLFTGSTAVGHHVMRAASANLTPVTLELGGKSPAIIGPGARFDNAVERIVFGKLVNAGQTCIAPDYVLLPRARVAEFIGTAQRITARCIRNWHKAGSTPASCPIASTSASSGCATARWPPVRACIR